MTPEQEVRARALEAAARVLSGVYAASAGSYGSYSAEVDVLRLAKTFESWLIGDE